VDKKGRATATNGRRHQVSGRVGVSDVKDPMFTGDGYFPHGIGYRYFWLRVKCWMSAFPFFARTLNIAFALHAQMPLFYIFPFWIDLFHTIRFHSIPFHSILFYSILFHSMLFYSILYHSKLFDSLPFGSMPFDSFPYGSMLFDDFPEGVFIEISTILWHFVSSFHISTSLQAQYAQGRVLNIELLRYIVLSIF